MSSRRLRKRRGRLALTVAMMAVLAVSAAALGGSAGGEGLGAGGARVYPTTVMPALWDNLREHGLPAPAAIVAGALLLFPFALSTLRIRRKTRST
jgi:hypothetical protein